MVVTPDVIAGTLFSAVGVETTVIGAARAEPAAQQLSGV